MTPAVRRRYLQRSLKLTWDVLARGRHDFTFDLLPMRSDHMSLRRRCNLIRSGLNVLHRRLRPWSWPIKLQVELTNRCNLQCPICPCGTGLLSRPRGDFDLELYRRLMAEVGPYVLTILLWGWGEPLLHPQFPQFIRIAREHGVISLLSTNGQNLAEDGVQEGLLQEPPDYLIVSVDGLTQGTYETYRVGASLEKALAGARRLAERKRERGLLLPRLVMRMIPMRQNEHEIDRAPEFAARNGFNLLTIRTLVTMADERPAYDTLLPRNQDLQAYRYQNGRKVRRPDYRCQYAFAFPAVLMDGSVVPCDQDFNAQQALGRIGNGESFADVWFGRQAQGVRRIIRTDRCAYGTCRNCPFADRVADACTVRTHDLRTGKVLLAERS